MTYQELVDFLEHRMSMSHVYQPLLVRALIDTGGMATVRQLAQVFLAQDESQLLYYEKRIQEMPLKVLKRHGVLAADGQLVSLTATKLTLEQKAHIRMLCEQKLQRFVQRRGIGIWDYRLLDEEPIPDSIRFQVLKAAGGRCQLCGISAKERPLDVDHIIPRSRGGKTELANLQALCSKCNRSKRNQDETDFRSWPSASADPDCLFCNADLLQLRLRFENAILQLPNKLHTYHRWIALGSVQPAINAKLSPCVLGFGLQEGNVKIGVFPRAVVNWRARERPSLSICMER